MVKETTVDILGASITLVCMAFAAYWLLAL